MKAKNLISCRILHLRGFVGWRGTRESSAFPERSGGHGTARCFHVVFPCSEGPWAGSLLAGDALLGGASQHSQAEAMLQHPKEVPTFAVRETEAVAVRDAGMFVTSLSHADPGGTGGVWGRAGLCTSPPHCSGDGHGCWRLAVPSRMESWQEGMGDTWL